MTKSRSLPKYLDDLSNFVADLRALLFSSQQKAATHFHLNRSTITRYESGKHAPPLGYLAALAQLAIEWLTSVDEQEILTKQRTLLAEVNKAVKYELFETPFEAWDELSQVAEAYISEQHRQSQSADALRSGVKPQNLVTSTQLVVAIPAQAPALPYFYVERQILQAALLRKIRQKRVHTLVLWGTGGTGKSTLATWLAKTTRADFLDGQCWIELSENLDLEITIAEAQAQLARSFGVILNETSLAERASQLRTLLSDKQCLVILDNAWTALDLPHLQVVNDQSSLLVTTRYRKVADVLEAPLVHIDRMTNEEGLALLTQWAENPVTNSGLVERLGGLPLALKLSGVQLREGSTPEELLTYFQQYHPELHHLDLDNPQNERESLYPCFEQSFSRLQPLDREHFAQLGCFTSRFELAAVAKVWRLTLNKARQILRHLNNQALVERDRSYFHLHPLLRDYVQHKLLATSNNSQTVYRRHAAYYLLYHLYHPQVLDDVTNEVPNLDESWADVVAGVKWATENAPQLAVIATLLAHTERPALLEAIGSPLITAVETYLSSVNNVTEEAFLRELLGDLYLLSHKLEEALNQFDQAASMWQIHSNNIFGSRARLRQAGVYLLQRNEQAALEALRQAQSTFAVSLPVTQEHLEPARWLFYWFDIIYSSLVKWEALDLLEETVATFVDLSQKANQPLLEARAWHIYRLFYAAKRGTEEDRQKARQGAARAAWLWWQYKQRDKALAEIMWTQEQTKYRRSQRLVKHFAQRLSQATPELSQEQIKLITNEKMRWWLEAEANERVDWLVRRMPPPGEDDWSSLDDILNIGTIGQQVRRIARGLPRPDQYPISNPLWKVLTGQRVLPLAGEAAVALVRRYRTILETELIS